MSDDDRVFPDRSTLGSDGSVRKAHYGDGEQPWDTMLRTGIAVHFATGCVLRYLRRDKDAAHSIESARWYWAQLNRLGLSTSDFPHRDHMETFAVINEVKNAKEAVNLLRVVLTDEERAKLR